MDDPPETPPCCFDEWAATNAKRLRRRETAAAVTASLLDALDEIGLEGRSVLDVGCGVGDLALATVARGASLARGIDLGAGAIAKANALARERGFADRTRFEIGDGSIAPLQPADVVVLDRVVCCYPDVDALLSRTVAVAGSVYALTAPVDRGFAGAVNRFLVGWSNGWYAIRRRKYRGFRVFVHDLDAVDERVRAAGFQPHRRRRERFVWELAVYTRDGAAA